MSLYTFYLWFLFLIFLFVVCSEWVESLIEYRCFHSPAQGEWAAEGPVRGDGTWNGNGNGNERERERERERDQTTGIHRRTNRDRQEKIE